MRRGCTTSTRGRLSASVDFDVDADGDAAKYRSATMPTTPIATNVTKALMPFRAKKFIPFMVGLSSSVLAPLIQPLGHGVPRIQHRNSTPSRAAGLAQNRHCAGRQDRATRKSGHAATGAWPRSPAG